MPYTSHIDRGGEEYFEVLVENPENHFNASGKEEWDFSFFNRRFLNITHRATTPFSSDLTDHNDDILIALLTLLLLLTIEGIISTILLRTLRSGRVRSFSLSLKLYMALIRDFNFPHTNHNSSSGHRTIRFSKTLAFAVVSLLALVFGTEIVVLILTEPHPRPVYNSQATFRIVRPIPSVYNNVRFHFRAKLDQPCSAVKFNGVLQKKTRMLGCVTTNITGLPHELFEKLQTNDSDVDVSIATYLHTYGMDHLVSVDGLTGEFASRAYFSLDDERTRLMSATSRFPDFEKEQVEMLHEQVIGYTFSLYKRSTKDSTVHLDYLNSLRPEFRGPLPGRDIYITSDGGSLVTENSTMYITKVRGKFPRGSAALRVIHNVLGTSLGISVAESSNTTDMFLKNGIHSAKGILWYEESRSLNWLTLVLTAGVALSFLIILRVVLKPLALAEIAAGYVKKSVRADMNRGPLELAKKEGVLFSMDTRGIVRQLGAETGAQTEAQTEAQTGAGTEMRMSFRGSSQGLFEEYDSESWTSKSQMTESSVQPTTQ